MTFHWLLCSHTVHNQVKLKHCQLNPVLHIVQCTGTAERQTGSANILPEKYFAAAGNAQTGCHLLNTDWSMAQRYVQVEIFIWIKTNLSQAVLLSFGFLISFGIRCNVGVAMVKTQSAPNEDGLYEFHWSPETIGYVDSSYFWGYVVTQVPGGFLASYIPANRLFGFAILFNSCLNLLIPTLTQLEPLCVIIARILQVTSWC